MDLPEFELERYFARYEFEVPYLLGASDVEPYRLDELLTLSGQEERGLWERLSLGYTESAGDPSLRAEVSGLYETVDREDVLVFSGAEEAIFVLLNVALGTGDHAVVTWPAYASLYEVVRAAGAGVTLLPLEHERGWALDLDKLRAAVRPETRLIVVNFPHNPTGALPDAATFREVVEVAREAGAYLLSDEVYRLLEHEPAGRLPAAVDLYDRAVSLGVMSKAFALAGLRIGWISTHDNDLLRRCAAFKDYTTICNSAPSEALALMALRSCGAVLRRSRGIVAQNLSHADRFFGEWRGVFEWVRPAAGPIGFPRLLVPIPVEEFAAGLVEEEGVMVVPGTVYGHSGNHFRLGLGRRDFPEALGRLERFAERRLALYRS